MGKVVYISKIIWFIVGYLSIMAIRLKNMRS